MVYTGKIVDLTNKLWSSMAECRQGFHLHTDGFEPKTSFFLFKVPGSQGGDTEPSPLEPWSIIYHSVPHFPGMFTRCCNLEHLHPKTVNNSFISECYKSPFKHSKTIYVFTSGWVIVTFQIHSRKKLLKGLTWPLQNGPLILTHSEGVTNHKNQCGFLVNELCDRGKTHTQSIFYPFSGMTYGILHSVSMPYKTLS
jgi:hypothetical protein